MGERMPWYFEPFYLDPDNASLWRQEQRVTLRPKTFDLLAYLVNHAGELLTKEALLDVVWPDTVVAEGVLATSMVELRKALGGTARAPRFIATVHKRGYRFIAPVTVVDPSDASTSSTRSEGTASVLKRPARPALVDRQIELHRLHQGLAEARAGQRQMWMVTGEAGIGKTSLIDAFVDPLANQEALYVGRGQCIDHYGAGEPYLPLLEAFGELAQMDRGQPIRDVIQQYAPSWLSQLPALLAPDDPRRRYQDLQGVSQERMLRELAEAVETLTASHLLIVVLEDLHWSDVSTLNWLAYIARRRTSSQLMILGTYRPVDAAVREHPVCTVMQELQLHDLCEELALDYLSKAGVSAYLSQRFGPRAATTALVRVLHQRTQGNPLFLIAMIEAFISRRVMVETPSGWRVQDTLEAAATIVPWSLRQLVEYHLQGLAPADQSLLEAASVAGATFTAAEVAAGLEQREDAVEARCQLLARHGQFMREASFETWPDGTLTSAYQFIHAIYHDAVYARIAAGGQRRLHRRMAARLEAAYAGHLSETAAQLAFHHRRGEDYMPAIRFHNLAAQQALSRSGYQEAIDQARQGLALLPHFAESPEHRRCEFDLHMNLGPALMAIKGYGDPEVEASYSRAQALCRDLGEETRMFPVLWRLWRFYNNQGDFPTARRFGGHLLALAQDQDDPAHRLVAH